MSEWTCCLVVGEGRGRLCDTSMFAFLEKFVGLESVTPLNTNTFSALAGRNPNIWSDISGGMSSKDVAFGLG